jgi:hypothetical protein
MRRFAARTQVRRSLAVTVSRAIAPTFNLHQQRQFGRHFQFWIFAGIALAIPAEAHVSWAAAFVTGSIRHEFASISTRSAPDRNIGFAS